MSNSHSQQKHQPQNSQPNEHTQILIEAVTKAVSTQEDIDLNRVEVALKAGADINNTSIPYANNSSITVTPIELLLNLDDQNPIPINNSQIGLVKLLLSYEARLPSYLYGTISYLKPQLFKVLLEHGLDITKSSEENLPLVYQLSMSGELKPLQTLLESRPEALDSASSKSDLPTPLYFCAAKSLHSNIAHPFLLMAFFLNRGARVTPDILCHSLEAVETTSIIIDKFQLVEFFKFWLNLFIQAGEHQNLITALAQPKVQQAFNTISSELSLTCIGLEDEAAQMLAQHLVPAKINNISLTELLQYQITSIDERGVHFNQNEAIITTSSLPRHFSLSLMGFKLVLRENPQCPALIELLSTYIPVSDHPVIVELFTSYQTWLNEQSGLDLQRLKQTEATYQFIAKIQLFLEEKTAPLENELEMLIKQGANINQVFYDSYSEDKKTVLHHVIKLFVGVSHAHVKKTKNNLIRFLLKHDADFLISLDESGPLTLSLTEPKIFLLLLKTHKIPLNIRNSQGDSLLHLAEHPESIQYLLDQGLKVNLCNHNGISPLYAINLSENAINNLIAINNLLLNHGAQVKVDIIEKLISSPSFNDKLYSYWIKYFMIKGQVDELVAVLDNPKLAEDLPTLFADLVFIDLSQRDLLKLQKVLPAIKLFNLSLENFLVYKMNILYDTSNLWFIAPATHSLPKRFSLSLVEFKLLLQRYCTAQPLTAKFGKLLEVINIENDPVLKDFYNICSEMIKPTIYEQMPDTSTTQQVGARSRLFHTDLRIVTADEPEPRPNSSYQPGD